ncbi:hypothetical protein JCGZ_12147 [Jatropha curcas]|uniref:Uncharacterized protein n=1 Tax=Jatropha curcas TaxID=180498 RepID=A0A067KKR0_JATCU|nr:hypothetical protein JCGZ_12147 [Jatropha curcas]
MSYIVLLQNVCKVHKIKDSNVDITCSENYSIEKDADVTLMFERFKDTAYIELNLPNRQVPGNGVGEAESNIGSQTEISGDLGDVIIIEQENVGGGIGNREGTSRGRGKGAEILIGSQIWDNVLADDTEYSSYVNGLGRGKGRGRGRCRGRAKIHEANVNRDNRKGKRATAVGASYSSRHRSTDDDYVFSGTEVESSESETHEGVEIDPEENIDLNNDVDDGLSDVDTDKE